MGGDHHELEEGSALKLDWEKLGKVAGTNSSVVPAAVQDARTGTLLILGYANETALNASFERGVCCLWSTSRNKLWIKGETSGDFLDLVEVRVNCEQNSLLYLVNPEKQALATRKIRMAPLDLGAIIGGWLRVLGAASVWSTAALRPRRPWAAPLGSSDVPSPLQRCSLSVLPSVQPWQHAGVHEQSA
eukprot:CAMPEP_0204005806 /NCGR_PEP_ID=MMETSP0360-20130528/19353_1 /ASSEMBLY_ACC=CAM_ASM_000342 /TAXON_ID=268821 /ORGANISM="Scrippsiella Hangoei, Strain SHTV-5" /LENGTH=187 /DNA_ID=CAMNT_0050947841 /DNA_START=84 /DNA_END=644 /DNA_ORIENTATION=-